MTRYEKLYDAVPEMENLVIFYSVFSPGSFLERSPTERDICIALNELFELNVTYEDEYLSGMTRALKGLLGEISIDLKGTRGFLPIAGKGFFPADYGAARRAEEHMKLNGNNEANLRLIKSLLLAKRRGHRSYIVVPPVRSDYKKAVGKTFAQLFAGLLEIRNEFEIDYEFEIINLFDDPDFSDEHFGDFDHLRPEGEGAALLSTKISEAVYGRAKAERVG